MYILIINPFSSTQYLAESIKKLGFHTIALYTVNCADMESYYIPDKSWFDKTLFLNSKLTDILNAVKDYKISYVLNGSEGSVLLSDQVARVLTPELSNDPLTAGFRTDKFLMHKALSDFNLKHMELQKFVIGRDNIAAENFKSLSFPCFVKPLVGASSHGIAKINSYSELADFFNNIDKNKLTQALKIYREKANTELVYLICEFIDGEEYLIDTFSCKGIHYVSSVQRYVKKLVNGKPIYRYLEIEENQSILQILEDYINKVLTATGMDNGFAHSEVFIKDRLPVLIEINSRISGALGLCNKIATLSGMPTQPELLVAVLKNTQVQKQTIQPKINVRGLVLFNFSTQSLPDLAISLSKCKTVFEIKQIKPVGFKHCTLPVAVAEAVAFIICTSTDLELLNYEIFQILLQDERGWA